ncbi:hypothetical protein ADUPG1_010249 [Aduncisulcus paluster]|uniref:Uncharacterized protein n=1 Tax=Aduncisulcus paluster TaxID=2918883 RepID=A0ABQ5JTN5_9EUKA|nr:hypothetical protein ADUPG1_010249 [Aduncisulcus paluster]
MKLFIGDYIRVKSDASGAYGFGPRDYVQPGMVGILKEVSTDGKFIVDFESFKEWKCKPLDVQRVVINKILDRHSTGAQREIYHVFGVGDLCRYRRSIASKLLRTPKTPTVDGPSIKPGDVGVVDNIDDDGNLDITFKTTDESCSKIVTRQKNEKMEKLERVYITDSPKPVSSVFPLPSSFPSSSISRFFHRSAFSTPNKDALERENKQCFAVGDYVRVRETVSSPKYGWGKVNAGGSVGRIESCEGSNGDVLVYFKQERGWRGNVRDLERVSVGPKQIVDKRPPVFCAGATVRFRKTVKTPRLGWGELHKDVQSLFESGESPSQYVGVVQFIGYKDILSVTFIVGDSFVTIKVNTHDIELVFVKGDEVFGVGDIVAVNRGDRLEIGELRAFTSTGMFCSKFKDVEKRKDKPVNVHHLPKVGFLPGEQLMFECTEGPELHGVKDGEFVEVVSCDATEELVVVVKETSEEKITLPMTSLHRKPLDWLSDVPTAASKRSIFACGKK